MKKLTKYLYENLNESEESIKSEKDFRDWAENKFKEAFGNDLDEDRMKKTIDGFLDDNKEDAENDEWGKLVGKFSASFGK